VKEAGVACGCEVDSHERKAVAVDPEIKASNLKRLRRIEGQVRGLQKMVEGDRYCSDILVQISSVQEALRGVSQALLRNHLRHCATAAITSGKTAQSDAICDELVELFAKFSR
jgi:CsoR family transcriptional regulator, copper-sensing transcriptional repressor